MAKRKNSRSAKKTRGRPFLPGVDPRRNLAGMSKEEAQAKNLAREVARAVLEAPSEKDATKSRLQKIFESAAGIAESGGLVQAEFLLKWAYGNPPQEVAVTHDGSIVIDLDAAVTRRATSSK